jgi:hypothetical protein
MQVEEVQGLLNSAVTFNCYFTNYFTKENVLSQLLLFAVKYYINGLKACKLCLVSCVLQLFKKLVKGSSSSIDPVG